MLRYKETPFRIELQATLLESHVNKPDPTLYQVVPSRFWFAALLAENQQTRLLVSQYWVSGVDDFYVDCCTPVSGV